MSTGSSTDMKALSFLVYASPLLSTSSLTALLLLSLLRNFSLVIFCAEFNNFVGYVDYIHYNTVNYDLVTAPGELEYSNFRR